MDGSDISLAIRRAKRSGATTIDLSHRGLRVWPEALFGLKTLQSLDLSGNELSSIDPNLWELEALEELNLSNNNIDALPQYQDMFTGASRGDCREYLLHLRSLRLDGNPIASRLAPATVRGLAAPPRTPGQTGAQIIRSLFGAALQPGASSLRSSSKPLPLSPMNSQLEPFSPNESMVDQHGYSNAQLDDGTSPAWLREDEGTTWRRQQKALLQEVETLRARVAELETQRPDTASAKPSWLHDRGSASMSATLPSRRRETAEDTEAADLKEQLREEQRKSKRLEKDVQRLTDRLSERDLAKGAIGSAAHFEMAEVDLGEMISQGGFSVVHKGSWHSTKVAVKKLFDPKITEELLAEFDNEVAKLEQLRHPNILLLLAVHRKPPALSLITELVEGGSLFQLLHAPHQFHSSSGASPASQNEYFEILEKSALALAFLHARGIIHRDVKSHNVLLSPHLEAKLCDFGLARMRSELMTGAMQFAGTPQYMAPEVFRQQRYTEKLDVFSFGTMFWECMAQDIPFVNLDPADIKEKVLAGRMLDIPRSTPSPAQAIIRVCWTLDQEARPFMAEVLSQMRELVRGGDLGANRRRRPCTAMASTGARESFAGSNSRGLGSLADSTSLMSGALDSTGDSRTPLGSRRGVGMGENTLTSSVGTRSTASRR